MYDILRKYRNDNKIIISKYMTKDKNLSADKRKFKSIIK